MQPGDQQFISFDDYSNTNTAVPTQIHVDLGTPNQKLFGPSGDGTMQEGFPDQKDPNAMKSFWTIEYYQKFFNINTDDVIERLKRSMIPHASENYLLTHIRPNPDLYGPFWVCVTLIFAIGISGNLANYFQYHDSGTYHWKYDFHLVSQAATCIFLYAFLLPLILWGSLLWTRSQTQATDHELIEPSDMTIGLLELLCLYGYSLTIYIPVAFLWTIQIPLLQWTLVIVAAVLSGGVLLKSLLPVIPGQHKPLYIAIILGMHLILAAGFMLYFFHVPASSLTNDIIVSSTTTTTTTTNAPVNVKIPAASNVSAPVKS
ncbi:hypothetical protein QAD02_014970 [Eretmocerus hayati]|uniref:Uncharacterized protein n=1 Tax=Eretmocerus hayati TaxID=131215 RepID=A0ACC2P7W0_9HYME|nr:hypothetical protein QAD02_014970 [Eretmocerus hayati]